jgi:hypothetical protein
MHMTRQRALRQKARWLRVAWAALFAVSTLLQLPAMAFAATSGSAQQEITNATQHTQAHQHHQHGHDHHDGSGPVAAHDGPACFAVGCCFALGAVGTSAPAAAYVLLGLLAHAPARTMLPSLPDPVVPPPRLQV